jgi:hypothetical protein
MSPTVQWYYDHPVDAESNDTVIIAKGLNIESITLEEMKKCAMKNVESYVRADGQPGVFDQLEQIYSGARCVFEGVVVPTEWYTEALRAIVTMSANEKKDDPPTSDWYHRNPTDAKSRASVIAKGLNIELRILEEMKEFAINNAQSPGVFDRLEQIYSGARCVFEGVVVPTEWYTEALRAIVTISANEKKDDRPTSDWYDDHPVDAESNDTVIAKGLNIKLSILEVMRRSTVAICAIIDAQNYLMVNDSKHYGVLGLLEQRHGSAECVYEGVEIPTKWYIGAFCAIITRAKTELPQLLVNKYYKRSNGAITLEGCRFWKTREKLIKSTE